MLPHLHPRRLDDGDGIEDTMMKHQASWHKTCRLKFSQTKLDRLRKRFTQEDSSTCKSLGVQTRSYYSIVDLNEATCFFCDEPAGLHNASL